MGLARTLSLLLAMMVMGSLNAVAQNERMESELPILQEELETVDSPQRRNRRIKVEDTLMVTKNTLPDPIKAALLSAALPGLGQIYNKSYWKVPVVYGSLMSLGYLVHYFDYNYIKFRNAFLAHNDGNPHTINPYAGDARTTANLFTRIEFHRRNRDYMMILTAGLYLLNIVEAHVDAHMQTFDLSDDISMNIRPAILPTPNANIIGISLNITFR